VTHDTERIYEMHRQGKTYQEIADELGVPLSTVGDIVRRFRRGRPVRTAALTAHHVRQLAALKEELENSREQLAAAQQALDEGVYAARADRVDWKSIASVLEVTPSYLSEKYIVNRRNEAVQRGAV